jgi:hypothetical protein
MRIYHIQGTTKKKGWTTNYEIPSTSFVEAKQHIVRERKLAVGKGADPRLLESQYYTLKGIKCYGE